MNVIDVVKNAAFSSAVSRILNYLENNPEENIQKAVACGINKINVCTDLMKHAKEALIKTLADEPDIEYMELNMAVEDAMKDFIKAYMRFIGSSQQYIFDKHIGPELD